MPQTTVEVERVEEETLTLCEDCSREIDEDGAVFESSDTARCLYYCSECLEEKGDDVDSAHIQRVEDWLDSTDTASDTMRKNIHVAKWAHLVTLTLAICGSALLAIGSNSLAMASLLIIFGLLAFSSMWLYSISRPDW